MISKAVVAGGILILLAACGWMYYDLQQVLQDNTRLQTLIVQSNKYAESLKTTIAINDQVTTLRNSFESFIEEEARVRHSTLQKLINSDKQVTNWSSTHIPASLLQLHKNSSAARNGTSTNSDSPAGTNSIP